MITKFLVSGIAYLNFFDEYAESDDDHLHTSSYHLTQAIIDTDLPIR